MRKMALFGTVMALVITLAVVVPVYGAQPAGIPPANHGLGHHPTPPLAKGTTLTISGSGTAYKISNRTVTETASISLTGTIIRSNPGRGMINFTGGTLTIGSDTYTVVSGHGIVTYHHSHMQLQLVVKNSAGATFHLVLFGNHIGKVSSTGFSVDFQMRQSKLAHLWFLKFPSATVSA